MKSTDECISYVSTHPWHKKGFSKLREKDLVIIREFLDMPISKEDASIKNNRLFIDQEKPKNFTIILEIISVCISYRY